MGTVPRKVIIFLTMVVERQSLRKKSAMNPPTGTNRARSRYGTAEYTPASTIDCREREREKSNMMEEEEEREMAHTHRFVDLQLWQCLLEVGGHAGKQCIEPPVVAEVCYDDGPDCGGEQDVEPRNRHLHRTNTVRLTHTPDEHTPPPWLRCWTRCSFFPAWRCEGEWQENCIPQPSTGRTKISQ